MAIAFSRGLLIIPRFLHYYPFELMNISLRPPAFDEVLAKHPKNSKHREFSINPEGGIFDTRNLAVALRRVKDGDVVVVPAGEYPAFELKRSVEIRALQPGVIINGTVKCATEQAILTGCELRASADKPALIVEQGTLMMDDCTIKGEIAAGSAHSRVRLFLRNCLAGNATEGIRLTHQAFAEISTTRIARCRIGVAMSGGSTLALYNSCLEGCVSADKADPGAGILAEQCTVHGEGVTFLNNDVGAYLKECPEMRFYYCHFHGSETAALVVMGAQASTAQLHSCVIDGQQSAQCAQMTFNGGVAAIGHTVVKSSPPPALFADQTNLEIFDVGLSSFSSPALDAHSCHISASGLTCESTGTASIIARDCRGTVKHSYLKGARPTELDDSPQLLFESCKIRQITAEGAPEPVVENASSGDEVMDLLGKEITQESVRNELARILRLAHAGQRRKLEGLPPIDQNFHSVFLGASGGGKFAAVRALARGLHAFGVITSPEPVEYPSPSANGQYPPEGGRLVFVHAGLVAAPGADAAAAQQTMERFLVQAGNVIIVEGERDEVQRLLRSSPALARVFRNTLHFASYGPIELTSLFSQLCEHDGIPLSLEGALSILLNFHFYSDRKDKRFTNTQGVETLYEAARRRYLERCSLANRFDLEMESRDFDSPQDRILRLAIERCPAFVSLCPVCHKENPWLPGLGKNHVCLHCNASYTASWGLWRDSVTYRRLKESLAQQLAVERGTAGRRISLPPAN